MKRIVLLLVIAPLTGCFSSHYEAQYKKDYVQKKRDAYYTIHGITNEAKRAEAMSLLQINPADINHDGMLTVQTDLLTWGDFFSAQPGTASFAAIADAGTIGGGAWILRNAIDNRNLLTGAAKGSTKTTTAAPAPAMPSSSSSTGGSSSPVVLINGNGNSVNTSGTSGNGP